jgi:hypothetical protein
VDAPRGRYSVIEKDGRLVVIDNGTGAPIPSSLPPPPRAGRGTPSSPASPGPVASAGPARIDRGADFLLAMAAREWDSEGRAVIAWRWRQNGREKRWDAALDAAQQRRMGRALLALCAAPLVPLLLIFADGAWSGLGALLILPPLAWAGFSLARLYAETDDPRRRE